MRSSVNRKDFEAFQALDAEGGCEMVRISEMVRFSLKNAGFTEHNSALTKIRGVRRETDRSLKDNISVRRAINVQIVFYRCLTEPRVDGRETRRKLPVNSVHKERIMFFFSVERFLSIFQFQSSF